MVEADLEVNVFFFQTGVEVEDAAAECFTEVEGNGHGTDLLVFQPVQLEDICHQHRQPAGRLPRSGRGRPPRRGYGSWRFLPYSIYAFIYSTSMLSRC